MERSFFRAAFALAFVCIVAAGALVFAQSPPPPQGRGMMMGRGGPGGPGPGALLAHLNLTADQKTQVQALMQSHRDAQQANGEKLMDLQQQLKNVIFADAGPGDTAALQQSIGALQAQMEASRIELEKQIAGVLTADQRKQVRDAPGPGFMGGRGRGRGFGH